MSLKLSLVVLNSNMDLTRPASAIPRLEFRFDENDPAFLAQFIDLTARGFKKPRVTSAECPRGFSLYLNEEEPEVTADAYGNPLRYIYADQFKQTRLPECVGSWDRAMTAFFASLAEHAPDTVVVLYPN